MRKLPFLLLCVITILISSCSNPEKDFQSAKEKNTIAAFQEFINKHPKSEFTATAKENVHFLAFEEAKQSGSMQKWQEYLKSYPQSTYCDSVLMIVDSLQFYKFSYKSNVDSLKAFQQRFTQSNYNSLIEFYVDSLEIESEWETASEKNTITAYNEFVTNHPESEYVEKARQKAFNLEYVWNDGFLDKKYYESSDKIKKVLDQLLVGCMAFSYQIIENGIINTYGVGDKEGKWSLNKQGGTVSVKKVKQSSYMIIGFKVNKGNKEGSLYFHKLLKSKL